MWKGALVAIIIKNKIKYLSINLFKTVNDLHTENYNTLIKKSRHI